MTPDDARKLLGGYATGSLTEAERKALFEAALEDQELFDELAGEQVLKEVLDEPGARQRLLSALESGPHRDVWWMRPWPWAAAIVTLAVVLGVMIFTRTPPPEPPQQIAQVMKSPEPAAAPVAAPPPARPTKSLSSASSEACRGRATGQTGSGVRCGARICGWGASGRCACRQLAAKVVQRVCVQLLRWRGRIPGDHACGARLPVGYRKRCCRSIPALWSTRELPFGLRFRRVQPVW